MGFTELDLFRYIGTTSKQNGYPSFKGVVTIDKDENDLRKKMKPILKKDNQFTLDDFAYTLGYTSVNATYSVLKGLSLMKIIRKIPDLVGTYQLLPKRYKKEAYPLRNEM